MIKIHTDNECIKKNYPGDKKIEFNESLRREMAQRVTQSYAEIIEFNALLRPQREISLHSILRFSGRIGTRIWIFPVSV